MYLGEMVEFDETDRIFTSPRDKRSAGLRHRPLRLKGGAPVADQHTVRAYDKDLDLLERRIAEMGGSPRKW